MPLTKIPFIAGVMSGFYMTFMEPAPPLQDTEQMAVEKKSLLRINIVLPITKVPINDTKMLNCSGLTSFSYYTGTVLGARAHRATGRSGKCSPAIDTE